MENKVKFIMDTDWLFQEPIDYEHKKYKLLAYFKKLDGLIDENKIYPMFTELSVHLASLQTVIKEKVLLYTNKVFNTFDDEVLLKELEVKVPPILDKTEISEIDKILKLAAPKFLEYFEIVKSQWSYVYDSITIKIKKNAKNVQSPFGYMVYEDMKTNQIYVWEYLIKQIYPNSREYITNLNLIFSGNKKENKLNDIIETNSQFEPAEKKKVPVFVVKSLNDFPLEETLIPLFKRKVISYIFQTVRMDLKLKN